MACRTLGVVSVCACVLLAAPFAGSREIPFTEDTLRYLMSFGYLPASDMETGNLRTDDQLRKAIRNLQAFGNVPVTGRVDEATLRLMAGPRCGVADDAPPIDGGGRSRRRRFAVSGQRWDHAALTWSLGPQHLELERGYVRRTLHDALDIWSTHSNLTFQEVNSDDADILVQFHSGEHGDGYAFDGPGRILAHAFFPGEERGGDAHFDLDETWLLEHQLNAEQPGDGTRLFMVAAHEFGHSLGLSHSSNPSSLMFPWYQSLLTQPFDLPEDDRNGIQHLYGGKSRWAKNPHNPGDSRPSRPSTPTTPPTTAPPSLFPTTSTSRSTMPSHHPNHRHHHHHNHNPPPVLPTIPPGKPDKCDTSFDAVSVIRRETFFFKGEYMWRVGERGLMEGYPARISHLWHELPVNLTHIDAVYERLDKKIVFFIGRDMYVFDGNRLEHGYPRSLQSLGLGQEIDHVDAAMVWGYNSKTYLYSGNIYWRFDEDEHHIELDYPREITTMWKGMGSHFDAAFQWKDGKTYFFKGKGFWKLNDMSMRATNKEPISSAAFWMNCSNLDLSFSPRKTKERFKKWQRVEKAPFSSSSSIVTSNLYFSAVLILYYLLPR